MFSWLQVPVEARTSRWIPWTWSYRQLWAKPSPLCIKTKLTFYVRTVSLGQLSSLIIDFFVCKILRYFICINKNILACLINFILMCVCVCVCVRMYVCSHTSLFVLSCHGMHVDLKEQSGEICSLLLPCGGIKLGHRSWEQAPLPTEPYPHCPMSSFQQERDVCAQGSAFFLLASLEGFRDFFHLAFVLLAKSTGNVKDSHCSYFWVGWRNSPQRDTLSTLVWVCYLKPWSAQ